MYSVTGACLPVHSEDMASHTDELDLKDADGVRPTKRARLDASLSITEDVLQEVMDEDDWDDVYQDSNTAT